jgi:hypothetical protein
MVARCQAWDGYAWKAAHPDAATISQHDGLLRKADTLIRANGDPGQIAQLRIEADALYDAPGKQRIANQCWAEVGTERQMNAEAMARLRAAAFDAPPPQTYMPNPDVYTLHVQPPAPTPMIPNEPPPPPPPPTHCIGVIPVPINVATPCPNP